MTANENGKPNGASSNPQAIPELGELPDSDRRLLRKCVLDLVALIQKPSSLRDVVSSKGFESRLTKLGWSENDAKKRVSLMLAVLPQTEALLAPVEISESRFRWRYDMHGFALTDRASLDDARAAVDAFRKLEEQQWLFRNNFQVGIDELQGRFGLFQGSLDWSQALQLANQLDAATGIGEAVHETLDGTLKLREYCAAIHAALPRFARAIVICKLLAPRKELWDALKSVTDGLELLLLSDEKRGERILETYDSLLKDMALPPDLSAKAALPLALRMAKDSDLDNLRADHRDWQRAYFDNWRGRVLERIGLGASERGPAAADVALLLARNGAFALLTRAWSQNRAGLWSEVALSALTAEPASDGLRYPKWCAPCALVLLGLIENALLIASAFDVPELESLLGGRNASARRRAVVLVAAEPSALAIPTWAVSQTYGALVISRAQLKTLAEHADRWQILLPSNDSWLFVEGTESDGLQSPESLLESTFPQPWRDLLPARRVQVFAREPAKAGLFTQASQAFKSTPRYFVGATSIDDAVSKADALLMSPTS